jgi:hypothetical protein
MNNFTDLLFNDNFLAAHGDFQLSLLYILELAINQVLELQLPVRVSSTTNGQ